MKIASRRANSHCVVMSKCLWSAFLLLAGDVASAQTSAQEVVVDNENSRIYAITHRTGLLKFLGHEHVILAERWSARVCWDPTSPSAARALFTVDTRSLTIDADSARVMAGLGKGPSPGQRQQIQRKLLDAQHLHAAQYVELRFESTAASGAPSELTLHGRLTIRDVTQAVALPVRVAVDALNNMAMTGQLTIRQSAFGMRPESIAGVVKVSDPVDLHVQLQGKLTGKTCVQ
jgi:polyisoprenoid-binding protein YceI